MPQLCKPEPALIGLRACYFLLFIVFLHCVHIKILLPAYFLKSCLLMSAGISTFCKLGYFLFLIVRLYLPLSFFNFQVIIDFLLQIAHCFAIF